MDASVQAPSGRSFTSWAPPFGLMRTAYPLMPSMTMLAFGGTGDVSNVSASILLSVITAPC